MGRIRAGLLAQHAAVLMATAVGLSIEAVPSLAQTALPPVSVDAPKPPTARRTQAVRRQAARPSRVTRQAAAPVERQVTEPGIRGFVGQRGLGPVDGYLANDSVTATKTDTPLLTTPQSISVVTKDQVQDQGAQNVTEAL